MSEKETKPTFNDIRESYGLPRIENKDKEIERLNNIIIELKKTLWQRCEETRKNEQYVRLNCYKDILNELVDLLMQGSDKE